MTGGVAVGKTSATVVLLRRWAERFEAEKGHKPVLVIHSRMRARDLYEFHKTCFGSYFRHIVESDSKYRIGFPVDVVLVCGLPPLGEGEQKQRENDPWLEDDVLFALSRLLVIDAGWAALPDEYLCLARNSVFSLVNEVGWTDLAASEALE